MKKKCIYKEFKNFLGKENFAKFKANFKGGDLKGYVEVNGADSVSSNFSWDYSPEGYNFWVDIDAEWREHSKKLIPAYSPDEIATAEDLLGSGFRGVCYLLGRGSSAFSYYFSPNEESVGYWRDYDENGVKLSPEKALEQRLTALYFFEQLLITDGEY